MTKPILLSQIRSFETGLLKTPLQLSAAPTTAIAAASLTAMLAGITASGGNFPSTAAVLTKNAEAEGLIFSAPANKVHVFVGKDPLTAADGSEVFGRITRPGADGATISLYTLVAGVETAYTPAAAVDVDVLIPLLFKSYNKPVTFDMAAGEYKLNNASGASTVTEQLTLVAPGTPGDPVLLPDLASATAGPVVLEINGISYRSNATNPAFTATVGSKTLTWDSAAAGFDLEVGLYDIWATYTPGAAATPLPPATVTDSFVPSDVTSNMFNASLSQAPDIASPVLITMPISVGGNLVFTEADLGVEFSFSTTGPGQHVVSFPIGQAFSWLTAPENSGVTFTIEYTPA